MCVGLALIACARRAGGVLLAARDEAPGRAHGLRILVVEHPTAVLRRGAGGGLEVAYRLPGRVRGPVAAIVHTRIKKIRMVTHPEVAVSRAGEA